MSHSDQKHVSTPFQVITFTIATILFCLIAAIPVYKFNTYDPEPELLPNSNLAAVSPALVRTGLHIRNVSKADMVKNDFTFEGTLWFEYDDQLINLTDLEKFTIEKGEIIEQSKPVITKIGSRSLAQFVIRARFKTNLNYRAYPLDDHSIFIIFSNQSVSADAILFDVSPENFTYAADVNIPNCHIEKAVARAGYTESAFILSERQQIMRHPRAIFCLECNRIDIRHFLNIFLPLLLIFFFTLFAFSFDFKEHGTTVPSIAAAGVPGLLAYRFVIESLSPDVSYFMLSDYLFFLFLFLVFLIFLFVAGALHVPTRTKKLIIISLYGCMLASCAALFYWLL